ncbi:MAG: Gldg family protein [Sphingosinicella sp.]
MALALGFFAVGRADALLFLAIRPWLILVFAILVAGWRRRQRGLSYALAIGTAGLSESFLLQGLGGLPWIEMIRGWAGAALFALAVDLLVQNGKRLAANWGLAAAALLGVIVLVLPGAMTPYEVIVIARDPPPSEQRPRLLLMTSLPLVWGETGPFDPASRPAAAFRYFEREFTVVPVDHLDARWLARARLMLLAQPQALTPRELVTLDTWVRGGGQLLILADPNLAWPSPLPTGDVRRPLRSNSLEPLFAHWGVEMTTPPNDGVEIDWQAWDERPLRFALAGSGIFRFRPNGRCLFHGRTWLAFCRIGSGRALLVADADLLHDRLWTLPGGSGEAHLRTADNPLLIARWLDLLAGIQRPRVAREIAWIDPAANRGRALAIAVLPILLLLGGALHALVHKHRPRTDKEQRGGTKAE